MPVASASPYRRAAYLLIGVVVSAALLSIVEWRFGDDGMLADIPVAAVLVVWALVVIVLGLVQGWRERRAKPHAILVACVSIAAACLTPVMFVGAHQAAGTALAWSGQPPIRQAIEIIAAAERNARFRRRINARQRSSSRSEFERYMWQTASDGTRFAFERQPPYRLAFPFPGHFREVDAGILYDPSDSQQRRVDTLEVGKSTDLLIMRSDRETDWTVDRCVHMIGAYWRCAFYP